MEEKRIIIEQTSELEPIKIEMLGSWKAKEINRIERLIIITYRRNKAAIRRAQKAELKKEE